MTIEYLVDSLKKDYKRENSWFKDEQGQPFENLAFENLKRKNVFIFGKMGTGRTFFLNSLAKIAIIHNIKVKYYVCNSIDTLNYFPSKIYKGKIKYISSLLQLRHRKQYDAL